MSFKKLVQEAMTHGADAVLAEKSPPGFKGTVKAMKDEGGIDNPYALSWWMKNKGYKSHKKADGTAKEGVYVEHAVHGRGLVESIDDKMIAITWDNLQKRVTAPSHIAFEDAKYLTRLSESKPVKESKKPMKKRTAPKKKIDESMVAVGMAPIGGTHRGTTDSLVDDDLEILRFDDLLSEDDEWKKPWEEDDSDSGDSDNDGNGDNGRDGGGPEADGQHGLRDAEDTREYDGADYTNVPRPSDSVLTNQEDQPSYSANPLATMAGAEDAPEGLEPDGDYQEDLLPVDAPDTPQVRELEGSGYRGNTRDAGDDSGDTSEVSDAGDYDESKPEDNGGEEKMTKKTDESAWLDMADLGLELNEMEDPTGGMDFDMGECGMGGGMEMGAGMQEHAMGEGEVAFTKDFLHTLLKAVAGQAPDESKLDALCQGLQSAQADKGDAGLDESDWDAIKSAAASAYGGGGDDMGDEPEMGGDDMGDEMEAPEFEDKAEGDGEEAGPEGGPEHEGKTKMMDTVGDESDDDDDLDESKGGTPVGTGNTSGSGGGNQQDLSKPKAYHGKPVGTGTSGAGGSNANEFGQKPQKDGGSNLLPAYEKGKQNGAHGTNFDGKAEKPAPRRTKPLAAESRKAEGKKKLDEHIMLGMSSIPGTIRGEVEGPSAEDWDDEMKTIKRRSGIENWWE